MHKFRVFSSQWSNHAGSKGCNSRVFTEVCTTRVASNTLWYGQNESTCSFHSLLEEYRHKGIESLVRACPACTHIAHSENCGPINPVSKDGCKYFVTFIDGYSHFTMVYLIKEKHQAFDKGKEYYNLVTNMFGVKILKLRSDNGGEYVSHDFQNFCKDEGIIMDYTVPYTPQQNGIAERMNRTLTEKIRAMSSQSGVPKEMWPETLKTATYLLNRSPTSCNVLTPAEVWYKSRPDLSNLKIFGCAAYNLIPKDVRQSKLDARCNKCVMIGYAPTGYRLYDMEKNKIIVSRDVKFNESEFPFKENNISMENIKEVQNEELNVQEELQSEENDVDSTSKRIRKPPAWHKDYDLTETEETHAAYFSCSDFIEKCPNTKQEAMRRDDAEKWNIAMQEELESEKQYQTWEVVPRPEKKKVIDSRWVFKVKSNVDGTVERYKARLVAKGFQSSDYQETYSPVAKLTTFRVLMSIANHYDYNVVQMDVKTAFLNGILEEEIYMNLPEDRENPYMVLSKVQKIGMLGSMVLLRKKGFKTLNMILACM